MKKVTKSSTPAKVSKPKASASERSSLSELFDAADINDASNKLSEGSHEVRLNEIKVVEDEKKGSIAVASYEAIDGDEEGKKAGSRYKLTDADGHAAPGMAYLKRDLALLGYEDIKGKKLVKTCEELTEAQPMCIINVKPNGIYTNVFLQGLAEEASVDTNDDEEEEAEEQEVEIGTQVSFTDPDDEDETLTGEVIKIKDETATVLVGKKKYQVEGSDLTIVPAEAEEPAEEEEEEEEKEIKVGSSVTWTNNEDEDCTGEVKKIKGDQATVEDIDGDNVKVDLSELTLVED